MRHYLKANNNSPQNTHTQCRAQEMTKAPAASLTTWVQFPMIYSGNREPPPTACPLTSEQDKWNAIRVVMYFQSVRFWCSVCLRLATVGPFSCILFYHVLPAVSKNSACLLVLSSFKGIVHFPCLPWTESLLPTNWAPFKREWVPRNQRLDVYNILQDIKMLLLLRSPYGRLVWWFIIRILALPVWRWQLPSF